MPHQPLLCTRLPPATVEKIVLPGDIRKPVVPVIIVAVPFQNHYANSWLHLNHLRKNCYLLHRHHTYTITLTVVSTTLKSLHITPHHTMGILLPRNWYVRRNLFSSRVEMVFFKKKGLLIFSIATQTSLVIMFARIMIAGLTGVDGWLLLSSSEVLS